MHSCLTEGMTEEIRLDNLADSLHLSNFYLARLFQRETGSSLSDYIMACRIKQACRLLYTTAYSVERVAADVGYPNVSYFNRLKKAPFRWTGAQMFIWWSVHFNKSIYWTYYCERS